MTLILHKGDVLTTGTGGLLGARVAEIAAGRGYSVLRHFHHWPDGSLSRSDFCGDLGDADYAAELARNIDPGIIINCAALADVDRCEQEPELSFHANVRTVINLRRCFPKARLVQISTDYVFPGIRARPLPDDHPEPINVYGRHKLEAEAATLESSHANLVIRAVLMFDNVDKRNFFRFVYRSLQQGQNVIGATDQYTNPISTISAAELILDLMARDVSGIWHIAGKDYLNRHEFAVKIAQYFSLDQNLIIPTSSEEIFRPAARPRLAGLDVSRTEELLTRSAPCLEEELDRIR